MIELREGAVVFRFPEGWRVQRYDKWTFYTEHFQGIVPKTKAVDFLALDPTGATLWLIEAKDYTRVRRAHDKETLDLEVARKTRDTLAGLAAARLYASDDEQDFAGAALRAKAMKLVLHLEQPRHPSALFPIYAPEDLQQSLKLRLKTVAPKPKVVSTTTEYPPIPWTTTWNPQGANP